MNNQKVQKITKQTKDNYIIKDREDYMTMAEMIAITKLSEYGAELCSAVIGFRFDPDHPGKYLFHRDDVTRFMNNRDMDMLWGFDVFTDPNYDPRYKDRFVDKWLLESTIRLCKCHREGDNAGYDEARLQINTMLREDRS